MRASATTRNYITAAKGLVKRFSAVTLSALVVCTMMSASIQAYGYTLGHDYVHYTANHVPSPTGTLEDITGGITDGSDGHVYDRYGNQLTINANSTISNSASQVVGFVYVGNP